MAIVRSAAVAIMILFTSGLALAQDSDSKVQVFAGYSLLNTDAGGLTGLDLDSLLHARTRAFGIKSNFNGWNAEAQYNFTNWFGVVGDFGGHSGTQITGVSGSGVSGIPSGNQYYFLAGPALTVHNRTKLTPFLHALFGWERRSLNASTITGLTNPVSTSATTYYDFTTALGGGLDYRLTRRFSLRLGQFDWFHTTLNLNKFYGSAFGASLFPGFLRTHERNLRYSGGVVVRF